MKAAQKSVTLTTNQYKAGTVSYLNVITAQTIALTDEIDRDPDPRPADERRRAADPGPRRRLDGGRAPVLRRRDEAGGSGAEGAVRRHRAEVCTVSQTSPPSPRS